MNIRGLVLVGIGNNCFNNFYNRGLISKGGVNIKANPLIEIVEFCKLKNLSWIYTNYQDTGSTYILSKGRIFTAEHTASVRGKRWKAELASHKNFAILLPTHPAEEYINFLQNSKIHYQKKYWKDRTLLWEFNGDPIAINKLRNLK